MMREMTTHTPPPTPRPASAGLSVTGRDNNDIQRELTDTQNQHLLAMDNYNQANERVIDLQLDLQQANEQIARMLQEHKKYRERRQQEIQQLTRSRDILHSIVVNRKKK
jgi:molecular chaperone GrpE (heat shock protein)